MSLAESVRQRLLNHAKLKDETFDLVLMKNGKMGTGANQILLGGVIFVYPVFPSCGVPPCRESWEARSTLA